MDFKMGSLVAPFIKRPPAKQETWVQSLGWEDTLEKEMATHSRILVFLPGKFYGQRSLMGYIAHGVTRVRHNLVTQPSPPWIKRKSKNHVWEHGSRQCQNQEHGCLAQEALTIISLSMSLYSRCEELMKGPLG